MKLGTYKYKHAIAVYPVPVFETFSLRVEILAETDKSFKVRYMEFHASGAKPDTVTWVARRKVKVDSPAFIGRPAPARLPYKDD